VTRAEVERSRAQLLVLTRSLRLRALRELARPGGRDAGHELLDAAMWLVAIGTKLTDDEFAILSMGVPLEHRDDDEDEQLKLGGGQ
jgi:hypothetical protein